MASINTWAPWVQIPNPGTLMPYYPTDLVVHTEEGMHPWAQLTVRYHLAATIQPVADQLPAALWWAEDTPVQITYGTSAASSASFLGYVVAPELLNTPQQSVYSGSQILDVRYTLLGVTKRLQTAKTVTWRSATASYMTQKIAEANSLAAVTDSHPRVFASRQQASQSDFNYLQSVADEIGWRLAVDGTTLYLTDPRRALVSTTPSFRQSRQPGTADTLQSFVAVVGETDPSGSVRAQHASVGLSSAGVVSTSLAQSSRVDPVSGQQVVAQVQTYATDYVANSYADSAAITAAATVRDLWWVHATATADGDVRLRPGCVVDLSGSALTSQYTGEWMTRSAHHRISVNLPDPRLSTYYVDLTLGRDQPSSLTRLPWMAVPATTSTVVNGAWASRRGGA